MKPSKTISSLCWKLSVQQQQRSFVCNVSTHPHFFYNTSTLLFKIPSSHFSTDTNNNDNNAGPTGTTTGAGSGRFNIPPKTSRWSQSIQKKQEAPKESKEDMSFDLSQLLIREQGNAIDVEENVEEETPTPPPTTTTTVKSSATKGEKVKKKKISKSNRSTPSPKDKPREGPIDEGDFRFSEEYLSRFEKTKIDKDLPEKTEDEKKGDLLEVHNIASDFESLAKEFSKEKHPAGTIDTMIHYPHYGLWPRKVREWVGWAKLPKGIYNYNGYYEAYKQDHYQDLADRERKRKHFDKYFIFTPKAEEKPLPPDLQGQYRFGIQPDELKGIHPKLIDFLSFKNANIGEIEAFRKQQAIKKYRKAPNDTGAMAAQIACLTIRITALSDHLKKHKQDTSSKRGLARLLTRRYQYLKYLKKHDPAPFYELLREYNLRDVPVQFWRNK